MPTDILRTKLYRLRVSDDLVPRTRLLDRLARQHRRPLILVAAPAGYGKTTLVSSWLAMTSSPGAWLSLDETDNDLSVFLAYVIAAIRTVVPETGQETLALLKAATLPPPPVLARSLINELDQLESGIILVLDDYHLIREPAIHELMNELLRHPPRTLQLVMTTRIDPPLNLSRLRVRNHVTEIRTHDLRFTAAETALFLEQQLGSKIDEQIISAVTDQTEGWVASLQLMSLSLRNRGVMSLSGPPLLGQVAYVSDYLVAEVLEQLSPAVQEFLLKTSIMDRLCGPLCEAVTGLDDPECDGQAHLEWLHLSNLFTIPLDDRREWYRYHHLFQQLLQSRLAQKYNSGEIEALHRRASAWLAQNGWLDEALQHALVAGDIESAVQLVACHRHTLIDREQWVRLQRWLRLFSEDSINQHTELLIIKAWVHNFRNQNPELVTVLDQIEVELARASLPVEIINPIRGEVYVLRANLAGSMGTMQVALSSAQRALELLPPDWHYATTAAKMLRIASFHVLGEPDRAYAELYPLLEAADFDDQSHHTTLLLYINCVLHWLDADMPALARTASRYFEIGQELRLPESTAAASCYLGAVHYQLNNLAAAERCFTVANQSVYKAHMFLYIQGTLALARTRLALDQPDRARETVEELRTNLVQMHSSHLLPIVDAFQADMDLHEGYLARAGHWARQYNPLPLMLMHGLYIPQFTLVKVWLAQNTKTSRKQAADLLSQLHEFVENTHNTRYLIEVLALQALLKDALGDRQAALEHLQQTVQLAAPGGLIRLFIDLGPQAARLFQQLDNHSVDPNYISEILAAFPGGTTGDQSATQPSLPSTAPPTVPAGDSVLPSLAMVESLTDRELEVLALLVKRLTYKEIAAQLIISPGTVTQHVHNIYQKLGVRRRKQALAKATELGILV